MESPEKLAYFLEEDTIRSVLPDWPADTALVLCLDKDGDYEVVIHHRDEGRTVLRKVASVLDRPLGQFMVAPPIDGYPTRRVLFSEEQQLLSLLEGRTDIVEAATDYSVNRRFTDDSAEPMPRTLLRRKGMVLPKARKADSPLPPGYTLAGSGGDTECQFVEAQIQGQGQRVRLVIEPAKVKVQTRPIRVAEVGFRDDFARFVLPRGALKGWRPGEPAVLDIPVEHFPAGLAERLTTGNRVAEVTITQRGVFVLPGPRSPVVVPEPEPPSAPRRRIFTPARVAAVLLVAAGALTGTAINAFRPDEPTVGAAGPVTPAAPAVALLPETANPDALMAALLRDDAGSDIE